MLWVNYRLHQFSLRTHFQLCLKIFYACFNALMLFFTIGYKNNPRVAVWHSWCTLPKMSTQCSLKPFIWIGGWLVQFLSHRSHSSDSARKCNTKKRLRRLLWFRTYCKSRLNFSCICVFSLSKFFLLTLIPMAFEMTYFPWGEGAILLGLCEP